MALPARPPDGEVVPCLDEFRELFFLKSCLVYFRVEINTGPESKYFWLCGPDSVHLGPSSNPCAAEKAAKTLVSWW